MATPSYFLIQSLQKTASKLTASDEYQWGHMGACNCGFLAQEITLLSRKEIHIQAMSGHGDWSEQLRDYCPHGNGPLDSIIDALIAAGLDTDDLTHLERLSDPKITGDDLRPFRYNVKQDVVRYLLRWAALLEVQILTEISLPAFSQSECETEPEIEECSLV